jgi:transcriptional regulator
VWTHRNPVECIASACSLFETLLASIAEVESIDRVRLGKAVMNFTKKTLEKAEEAFIKLKEKNVNIIHVKYEKLVSNPKSICKNIFEKVFYYIYYYYCCY